MGQLDDLGSQKRKSPEMFFFFIPEGIYRLTYLYHIFGNFMRSNVNLLYDTVDHLVRLAALGLGYPSVFCF